MPGGCFEHSSFDPGKHPMNLSIDGAVVNKKLSLMFLHKRRGLCRKVVNKKFNFINRIKRKTSIWEVHGLSQRDVNPVYKKS